jgi:hypothetical protein
MKMLLLLMLVASPCVAQIQQQNVVYAAEFTPPVEYRQWYHKMEVCTGMRGDYAKIIWAVSPHAWITANSWNGKRGWTYGQWTSASGGRALIVLNADDWKFESYVTHEMLHDILWRNGFRLPSGKNSDMDSVNIRRAHPAPPFEKCAPTYIEQMRAIEAARANPYKQVYQP